MGVSQFKWHDQKLKVAIPGPEHYLRDVLTLDPQLMIPIVSLSLRRLEGPAMHIVVNPI